MNTSSNLTVPLFRGASEAQHQAFFDAWWSRYVDRYVDAQVLVPFADAYFGLIFNHLSPNRRRARRRLLNTALWHANGREFFGFVVVGRSNSEIGVAFRLLNTSQDRSNQ